MTSCVNATNCTCVLCAHPVTNITNLAVQPPSSKPIPSSHPFQSEFPTPQSLPRLGTQFTPGLGETTIDDTKETIPFQDLSKLAKRRDWAVVKMTNVSPHLYPLPLRLLEGWVVDV